MMKRVLLWFRMWLRILDRTFRGGGLFDYFRARRVFQNPLRVVMARYYKGPPRLTELKLKDGRSLWIRTSTNMAAVWRNLIFDEYRIESNPRRHYVCVLDVGAHIGTFSLRIAPRASRILAFEPVRENFELLERNLLSTPSLQVELFPMAVSDRAGSLQIYLSAHNTDQHTAFPSSKLQTRWGGADALW